LASPKTDRLSQAIHLQAAKYGDNCTTCRIKTHGGLRRLGHLREQMKQIAVPPFVIAAARNTFVATPKLKMLLDDEGNMPIARAIQAAFPDAPVDIICIDLMLADLGVVKSRSRPHTSNNNPFSEAHFKTLKYQPESPRRLQTIDEAHAFCRRFFA
jgi:hypothetical protein